MPSSTRRQGPPAQSICSCSASARRASGFDRVLFGDRNRAHSSAGIGSAAGGVSRTSATKSELVLGRARIATAASLREYPRGVGRPKKNVPERNWAPCVENLRGHMPQGERTVAARERGNTRPAFYFPAGNGQAPNPTPCAGRGLRLPAAANAGGCGVFFCAIFISRQRFLHTAAGRDARSTEKNPCSVVGQASVPAIPRVNPLKLGTAPTASIVRVAAILAVAPARFYRPAA